MPTKNNSASKSTFVDSIGTLISARRAFVVDKPQNYGFACVQLGTSLVSGICDLEFIGTPRGTQVVVTQKKGEKTYRVW